MGSSQRLQPTDTEVRLAWAPPTTGGRCTEYRVQYRVAGAPPPTWSVVTEQVLLPHHTVLGLTANTTYDFQVQPINAGLPGPARTLPGIMTAAAPAVPAGAPGPVSGLRIAADPATVSSISVAWDAETNNPPAYIVAYRLHDSVEGWRTLDVTSTGATVKGLSPGNRYDVRVAAKNNQGVGPWTSVLTCITAREPKWSDLVVIGEGRGEVDVTRVQMLFFTVVTALFVASTVVTDYQIPTIPEGFVALIGSSNGFYIGSKFV